MFYTPISTALVLATASILFHTSQGGSFWHISDLHLDYNYITGGQINNWCHKHSTNSTDNDVAGPGGNYNCDSSSDLVISALEAMKRFEDKPDFIVWTGDTAPHGNTESVEETYIFNVTNLVFSKLEELFPDVPVVPTLGNHDVSPPDQFPIPNNSSNKTIREYYTRMLEKGGFGQHIEEEGKETFKKCGYYTKALKNTTLRFIVLNTNIYYSDNYTIGEDPCDQLDWFNSTLQSSNETVFVVAHVPPGAFERRGEDEEMEAKIMFNKPDETYHQINQRFIDIVTDRRNAEKISSHLYGHLHTDTFRMFMDEDNDEALGVGFVAGSVAPVVWAVQGDQPQDFGTNPSIRLFTYNDSDFSLMDYSQYSLDISHVNVTTDVPEEVTTNPAQQTNSTNSAEPTNVTTSAGLTNSTSSTEKTNSVTSAEQINSTTSAEQTNSTTSVGQKNSTNSTERTNSTTSAEQTNSTTSAEQTNSTTSAEQTNSTTSAGQTNATTSANQTNYSTSEDPTNSSTSAEQTNSTTLADQTNSTALAGQTNTSTSTEQTNSTTSAEKTNSTTSVEHTNSTTSTEQTNSANSTGQTNSTTPAGYTNSTTSGDQTNSTTPTDQQNVNQLTSQWKLLYKASEAFNVSNLSAKSMFGVVKMMVKEQYSGEMFQNYYKHNTGGHKWGDKWATCDAGCWRRHLCTITNLVENKLEICLKENGESGFYETHADEIPKPEPSSTTRIAITVVAVLGVLTTIILGGFCGYRKYKKRSGDQEFLLTNSSFRFLRLNSTDSRDSSNYNHLGNE